MFDFRYHTISLIAVLIALAIGLLLGVAIGDRGLVSSAEKDIKQSLRADVRREQERAASLSDQLADRQHYEDVAYPSLVNGLLVGRRIGLVELGGTGSGEYVDLVKSALKGSGATLESVSNVSLPIDREAIAEDSEGTPFARLADDPSLARRFGRRVGRDLVHGDGYLKRVRDDVFENPSGSLERLDGIVLVRNPVQASDQQEREVDAAFEDGLVAGLKSRHVPVVGVEQTTTDPSQIEWYKDRGLSSVDDIDDRLGRAAVVFALVGQGGTFGVKSTADSFLPPVVGTPGA